MPYTTEGAHTLTVGRFRRGLTPTRPARPLYGTRGRCSCGWDCRSNDAPSKGGRRWVEASHRLHCALVASQEA